MSTDDALASLFLPLEQGRVQWPEQGGALFLGARDGEPVHRQPRPGLLCAQDYKPEVDALLRAGWTLADDQGDGQTFALILLLPPRQREHARAVLARALARLSPGGVLVLSQANDEGAKSAEGDLRQLANSVDVLSKNKCRVVWTRADSQFNSELMQQWQGLDAPRRIAEGRFLSRPGVFAWDRIDVASQLLAEHLPSTLAGRVADLGGGYGYLSAELLQRCPAISALDVYEADARALDLARQNLMPMAGKVELQLHWHDVGQGLLGSYDWIVSNPPFHAQNSRQRPDLGRRFLAAAAAALVPGGRLWLVANRHLPYEEALGESFSEVRRVIQGGGFKVIEAIKARAAKRFAEADRGRPRDRRVDDP